MPTLTQDDLLAVIDRAIPDSYLEPLKDPGPGYELYQAAAKVGERCSTAIDSFSADVYIATSQHGVTALITVTFYRTTATAGAGVMMAGTVVRASRGGQRFRTTADAPFGALDLETTATAEAIGFGYEWNVAGPFVDRFGNERPGEIDKIDLPLQSPPFWDSTIKVRNDAGPDRPGRPATLDALGAERDLPRQVNEDDPRYRIRVRSLPDTVSPAAIRRQLKNYFRRFPTVTWTLIETWQHEYQECYDAPDLPPTPTQNYDSTLFVYDDPRPPSPFRNRYLGENDYLGAFIVEVSAMPSVTEFAPAYDDPTTSLSGVSNPSGYRAFSAYDVAALASPGLAPAYDGSDPGADNFLIALLALLEEIKASGVFVAIVQQEI